MGMRVAGGVLGGLAEGIRGISDVVGGVQNVQSQRLRISEALREKAEDMEAQDPGSGVRMWEEKVGPWFSDETRATTRDSIVQGSARKRFGLAAAKGDFITDRVRDRVADVLSGSMTVEEADARMDSDMELIGYGEPDRATAKNRMRNELKVVAERKSKEVEAKLMALANNVAGDLAQQRGRIERKVVKLDRQLAEFDIHEGMVTPQKLEILRKSGQWDTVQALLGERDELVSQAEEKELNEMRIESFAARGELGGLRRFLDENPGILDMPGLEKKPAKARTAGWEQEPPGIEHKPSGRASVPPSSREFESRVLTGKSGGMSLDDVIREAETDYSDPALRDEAVARVRQIWAQPPGRHPRAGPFGLTKETRQKSGTPSRTSTAGRRF